MRNRRLALALMALAACGVGPKREAAAPEKPPEEYRVEFTTTKGSFTVEVKGEWAPRGADHFHELVSTKFYDGARFHRVIRGFVVQFGIHANPKTNAIWSTANIPDDPVKLRNRKGTVAYAKIGPNSRATEVFINLRDNLDLDKSGFAAFGRVSEGMEVVEKLYWSYGELPPRGSGPDPGLAAAQGESYFAARFPRLDRIEKAVVLK
jgi:peptidyl-prolyl cis-trans isomerase A (cyclophilin A)